MELGCFTQYIVWSFLEIGVRFYKSYILFLNLVKQTSKKFQGLQICAYILFSFSVLLRYKLICDFSLNNSNTLYPEPGNTKGGSITVPLTSCLTGLD
jgi:hypothetical protein